MLAGKFDPQMQRLRAIANSPVGSAVAGGAAAAGLSALGNVGSDKPGERIAIEALGAAGLGAVAGSQLPALRQTLSKQNVSNAVGPAMADVLNNVPMDDAERVKFLNIGKGAVDAAPYGSGALSAAALTAAGGLGGQFGGGAANLMGIDPENPGSSNTMGARYSMGGMPPMYG